jgi:hypothetical protein
LKHFRPAGLRRRLLAINTRLVPPPRLLHKGTGAMLSTDQINDVHRLYWSERWAIRKIERHLKISWKTIRKYLQAPAQTPALRSRVSKLDPF